MGRCGEAKSIWKLRLLESYVEGQICPIAQRERQHRGIRSILMIRMETIEHMVHSCREEQSPGSATF